MEVVAGAPAEAEADTDAEADAEAECSIPRPPELGSTLSRIGCSPYAELVLGVRKIPLIFASHPS